MGGIRSTDDPDNMEDYLVAAATTTLNSLPIQSVILDRVRMATTSDVNMHQLLQLIESGLPRVQTRVSSYPARILPVSGTSPLFRWSCPI